jgi:hypothetical protein
MIRALLIAFLLCHACYLQAQIKVPAFSKGAVILETQKLISAKHLNRALVLWMLNPKKNPYSLGPNESYTCPDETRGSYYSGPTRVSLIDSSTNRVINTINIESYDSQGGGSLDLPYDIRRGYYYRVDAVSRRTQQGKPKIMWLRDYNGDGKPFEFALFDAPACMGLQTTLIGYSEKHDKVIQYAVNVAVTERDNSSTEILFWIDYLFSNKPQGPRYWKYEIDYRGRGGSLDKWEVKYDQRQERFQGTVVRIGAEL